MKALIVKLKKKVKKDEFMDLKKFYYRFLSMK